MSERDPDQGTPSAEPSASNLKTGGDHQVTESADLPDPAETAGSGTVSGDISGDRADDEPANRRARRAAAAQARKHRMREREDAQAVGLGAQEILDDAFVRSTDRAGKWLRRYSSVIQWALVGGVAAWAVWGIYDWRQEHVQAEASDALAQAAQAQSGKVGADENTDDEMADLDPTPVFADEQARLSAAETGFRTAAERNASTGTALYARLGLASVLLDQGKFDEARAQFETVAQAPASQKENDLLWRALEGTAQAHEGKGDKQAAFDAYGKLVGVSSHAYSLLGQYNQARLLRDLGRIDEAKQAVEKLQKDLPAAEGLEAMFPGYLEQSVRALASALGVKPAERAASPITADQIRQLAQDVQGQLEQPAAADTSEPPEPAP